MRQISSVLGLLNLSVFFKSHLFLLPVLYLFYTSCGITLADFFLIQGLSSLTCLLLDVPMGYIADRVSKKKILICSNLILVLRFLLLYFFPTKFVIFLGEILYAFVIVSFVGTGDSYIYELLKTENKTVAMLKRYGRLYFWISIGTSIASLSGAYIYGELGAKMVILLTLIFTSVSTLLLLFIPDIDVKKKNVLSMKQKYLSIYAEVKRALKNREFINLITFSAFLTATYQIFMWSMQPVMKLALVPVTLFGVIFFLNHMARASGSYFAHKVLKKFNLVKLGWIVYFGFILSFFAMIGIGEKTPLALTLALLVFICLMISLQVTWLISAIARIHEISTSKNRALSASVNSMAGRLLTAICLILSKFILDGNPLSVNLLIFLILFIPSALILKKWKV
ncbi:MAG: MFS transporter [Alphaproteobacteria bacterium]|nr:MFS transporter [Alphaproteobacteria bacterium]